MVFLWWWRNNLTHDSMKGGISFTGIIDNILNYNIITITVTLMSMKKMQIISNNHYSYIRVNTKRMLFRGTLENVVYYNPEHFH